MLFFSMNNKSIDYFEGNTTVTIKFTHENLSLVSKL
jgi:hypothetical protein